MSSSRDWSLRGLCLCCGLICISLPHAAGRGRAGASRMARACPGQHPGGHTQVIPLFFGAFLWMGICYMTPFSNILMMFKRSISLLTRSNSGLLVISILLVVLNATSNDNYKNNRDCQDACFYIYGSTGPIYNIEPACFLSLYRQAILIMRLPDSTEP